MGDEVGQKMEKGEGESRPSVALRPTNLNTVKFSSYFKAVDLRNFPPLPSDGRICAQIAFNIE